MTGLHVLVAHYLRQSGSADSVQRPQHVVCRCLGVASLLTHIMMHPGDPVALTSSVADGCRALSVGALHGQVGEARWCWVKRNAAQIFAHAHLAYVGVPTALQLIQGHRWRLLEGGWHGRRGHI